MKDNPLDPMDPKLRELVRAALPPADTRLRRDLWHEVEARIGQRQRRVVRIRLKWWEWALAAGDLGAAFYAPEAIPALLYHI